MDSQGQSIETRIGTLSFTHDFANGYPTKETVEKLYDERDFQRACQAYLWALPIVAFAEWQHVAKSLFNVSETDLHRQQDETRPRAGSRRVASISSGKNAGTSIAAKCEPRDLAE
jgi:hypothetical protein